VADKVIKRLMSDLDKLQAGIPENVKQK
jgi:hypothetical protein